MAEQQHREAPPPGDRDLDSMGNDKRRHVVGGQYGATLRKRLLVYGAAVAVIAVVVIAFLTVVSSYDDRDQPIENTAPWAGAADTRPPRDVDFKANGPHPDRCAAPCNSDVTIPVERIFNR